MADGNQNPVYTDSTLQGDGTSFAPLSVTGGGAPGGTNGQIQFDNAGAFGGIPGSAVDAADESVAFALSGPSSGLEINPSNAGNSIDFLVTPLALTIGGNSGTLFEATSDSKLGFFAAAPIVKPTVAGAKLPGDVVMASLLTALKNLGLINDTTT